jgi:hypothetical protein
MGYWTIFPGWPQTSLIPILASQVARISGVSHWCLAKRIFSGVSHTRGPQYQISHQQIWG